jgi:hypothetical protein
MRKNDEAAIELTTAEYPKVLVDEVGVESTKKQIDDFNDAGGIHLPFPAIVLCGFNTEANLMTGFKDGTISKESTVVTSMSSVTTTYLYEHEDDVYAIIMAIDPNETFSVFYADQDRVRQNYAKNRLFSKIFCWAKRRMFTLTKGLLKHSVSRILYCIHKMTFSDGGSTHVCSQHPERIQVNKKN